MTNIVKVFKWERKIEEGRSFLEKVENGEGTFCAWGSDFEEMETGVGTFSTAIVRRADGTIENVPVEMVQFLDASR